MYGKSYWASTQWHAAVENHPNLKAIIPQNTNPEPWKCGYRTNGVLSLAMTARGRAYDQNDWEAIDRLGWDQYFRHLPLLTLDKVVGGASAPGSAELWRDYVSHTTFDEFWKSLSLAGEYETISIPVFLMGGWYDYYPGAVLNSFVKLRDHGNQDVRVTIDSSDHLNRSVGDRDFGNNVPKNELELAARWLDHVVKGESNGVENEPPVQIFVMGLNQWRYEDEWPLARTSYSKYYFHSPDGSRHGSLNTDPPGAELPTEYVYDPENPVPSIGGNHSFSDTNIPNIIRAGSVDQRPNEKRSDVLVFTSEPLHADLEVTGPVVVKLFASSSARDTDFTAKLVDVYPDGSAYNLTEGVVRARFRKSIWEPPELIVPGEIYEYSIELLPTSNVFQKGHRVRVHLTSSNFPHWERNLNTGDDPATDVAMQKAEQTVYHDRQHSSHIVLPIIPPSASAETLHMN
jgi:putative CocE/NonD family hydrolase